MRSWNTTPCKDQSPVSALLQKSIFQTGYHQGIISGTPISDKSRLFFRHSRETDEKSGAEAPLYHNFYLFKAIYFTRYRSSPSLSPGLHRIGFEAYFRTRNGFLPRGILLWEKHLTPGHRPKAVYRRGRPTALYPGLVLSHRRAGSLHRQPRQPPSCRKSIFFAITALACSRVISLRTFSRCNG